MAIFIKSSGEERKVQPKNGTDFSMEEILDFVGGYFELLTLPKQRFMVVNEEGKLLKLPINTKASAIYGHDIIVGDVLICEVGEIK